MISGSTTWFVSPLVVIVASPAVSTLRSQSTLVAYGSGSTNPSTTRSAATGAAHLIPERRPVRRIAAAYQCLQWPSASCGVEQVFVERTDRVPDCNHHVAGHCLMLADQPGVQQSRRDRARGTLRHRRFCVWPRSSGTTGRHR